MKTIGERLDYIRKEIGLTYKDLGVIVGLTESGLRQSIKRNNLKPNYINIITDKTEISKEWLLTGSGNKLKEPNADQNFDEMGVLQLIEHLLVRKDELLKSETYRDYIRATMELIMADDERKKKNKALEELREIALKKHSKKTN